MTKLLYLENFTQLECSAKVVETLNENGKDIIILDQTIFYPQGGGQPYDTGIIKSADSQFTVEEVRFADGVVKHIGRCNTGSFNPGDAINCIVDKDRRLLNSRLHSAGHVVDMAIYSLELDWIPGKGYHFPEGPYVEYAGTTEEEAGREKLKTDIEKTSNKIIQEGTPTKILFMKKEEMGSVCRFVPDYIPEGKPGRVVLFGDPSTGSKQAFGVPCGGTHVSNLREIVSMTIRKVKQEKDRIRVSYDVSR